MKNLYSRILGFILIILAGDALAVDVGGIISTDTTWANTNEAYNITTPVQIAHGSTLTIESGVRVNGGEIQVFGNLTVEGSQLNKTTLSGVRVSSEGTYSETASISIKHAILDGGELYHTTAYGTLLLQDSYLSDLPYINLWYPTSDVVIRRNIFENFSGISAGVRDVSVFVENNHFKSFSSFSYPLSIVESWNSGPGEIVVRYNSFQSYPEGYATGLQPGYTGASIDARHNYWGTTSDAEIQQMIYDKNDDLSCADYIDYLPILTAHHPDTPIMGAEISIEDSVGSTLENNGVSIGFLSPLSANSASTAFTINNIGNDVLSGLALEVTGLNSNDFSCTTLLSNSIPAGGSSAFSVTFTPSEEGEVNAAISIGSNDADDNPFVINLVGFGLSEGTDTDLDGLNDLAEFLMSDLGFDWQTSQNALVSTLFSNSATAGLYTESQIKQIYADSRFLEFDQDTELFSLSVGISVSANLTNEFVHMPVSLEQVSTNELGEIDIQFTSPDDSAFYRIK